MKYHVLARTPAIGFERAVSEVEFLLLFSETCIQGLVFTPGHLGHCFAPRRALQALLGRLSSNQYHDSENEYFNSIRNMTIRHRAW